MHTKPREVHERENETERGGTSVASHTRLTILTFGLAQRFFSRKLFFQPQVTEMSFKQIVGENMKTVETGNWTH